MFYADRSYGDPHSGNYVFMNDGRLGLLDFGCIQHFTREERQMLDRGEEFFDKKITLAELMRIFGVPEADFANPDYVAASTRHNMWLVKPLWHVGPFDFGDEAFFKEGIDSMHEIISKRYTAAPPMYVYLFRAIFGWRALALRLRCRVDQAMVRRQELKVRQNRGQA
jgi:aarF domain-containing kinase